MGTKARNQFRTRLNINVKVPKIAICYLFGRIIIATTRIISIVYIIYKTLSPIYPAQSARPLCVYCSSSIYILLQLCGQFD